MAKILVIEDDPKINRLLERVISDLGHQVSISTTLGQGVKASLTTDFDVVLLDLTLPDGNGLSILQQLHDAPSTPEIIIVTGTGNQRGAEVAFKNGAWDFVPKPFLPEDVALPLTRALQYREEKTPTTPRILAREQIIGDSAAMNTSLRLVAQASMTDANVLVIGETGTGKELFAHAIHANSSRADQPFVVVDCAAHTEQLLESSLFGHEKGAFTGAEQSRVGLVTQATQGTLFLDEVGELTPAMQKSFLRVLQEHTYRPIGSSTELVSDFRLVAATNRDLEGMVSDGSFRLDLLHRLRSLVISLPPLRQHLEDLDLLVVHHLQKAGKAPGQSTKGFTQGFLEALKSYKWPGNIRELFNTLDYALAHSGNNSSLYQINLPSEIRLSNIESLFDSQDVNKPDGQEPDNLDQEQDLMPIQKFRESRIALAEKQYLLELMRRTSGRIKDACAIADLSESRLHALLKRYDTPRFR